MSSLLVLITLLLQDTAGSERYEAMSRIYYRGAKAAVLCYGKHLSDHLDPESDQHLIFLTEILLSHSLR